MKSKYPKNWKLISQQARRRAGNKCQRCGVPNGVQVIRMLDDQGRYSDLSWQVWTGQVPQDGNRWSKPTKVVLHVHHIGLDYPDGSRGNPHDKSDCRPENLIVLCQKHHLEADLDIHVAVRKRKAATKRNEQLEQLGQERMFT